MRLEQMLDLDDVHLVLLGLFDLADEYGVSTSQARIMLREAVEIAGDIADACYDDWPEPISTAIH